MDEMEKRVAIIGTGRMAQNLALGWLRAGIDVVMGSRTPERRGEEASKFSIVDHDTAMGQADVVVLAIPYTSVEPFARANREKLDSKLVIDISNPFDNLPDNRISGAEITAKAIGRDARVLAAFKDNFWQTLLEPTDTAYEIVRDVHFAGDNDADKQILAGLIEALGFRPIDCGPLVNARVLDVMVPLMIQLDKRYRGGEGKSSWRLLSQG